MGNTPFSLGHMFVQISNYYICRCEGFLSFLSEQGYLSSWCHLTDIKAFNFYWSKFVITAKMKFTWWYHLNTGDEPKQESSDEVQNQDVEDNEKESNDETENAEESENDDETETEDDSSEE